MLSNLADPNACDDIAEQLVQNQTGSNFKVILGGGRGYFIPNTVQDPETGANGRRRDGKNLINTWLAGHPTGSYVWNRNDLLAVNTATTGNLLGIFKFTRCIKIIFFKSIHFCKVFLLLLIWTLSWNRLLPTTLLWRKWQLLLSRCFKKRRTVTSC